MSAASSPPPAPADRAEEARRWISALADGEGEALSPATLAYREQAPAREAWHLYHLIGDVLRSEDLAVARVHPEAFITRLRARLADEPVPLAPAAVAALPRRWGWQAPTAVAAGFAAVAVAVVFLRPAAAPGPELIATSPAAVKAEPTVRYRIVDLPAAPAAGPRPTEDRMIRDARLDDYLRAHQAARGNAAAATPGGALRSVEMLLPPQAGGSAAAPAR
jgi:sigma-E factor negative regulatory protein RseA